MKQPANRVWSRLEIKSIDEEQRIIEGIASTPSTDLMDDIIDPMGGEYTVPMPFLMDHGENGSDDSVGHVIWAKPTKEGIPVRIQILRSPILPALDRAWEKIRLKLVNGLSIGFQPLEYEPIKGTFGYLYKRWKWLELSAVVVAANPDCSITSIKSFDIARRAASGHTQRGVVRLDKSTPGVSGKQLNLPKGNDMSTKTIAEQISAFEAKRAASAARMSDIMAKSAEDGSTLDETQTQEYDGLLAEVKAVDEHIVRLKAHEVAMVSKATQITAAVGGDPAAASKSRGGSDIVVVGPRLEPGQKMARFALALKRGRGNLNDALSIYQNNKGWMDTSPEVALVLKAAVAAGDTTTSGWASELVYAQNLANEFIEYLRPKTILGQISNFRRVPFNVRMGSATAGSTGYWVGQGLPVPMSKLTTSSQTLGMTKAAGLVALDEELVRSSSPSAELLVRDDLGNAIIQVVDTQFIDPNQGGVANVSPASVLYGVTPITPSGTNAAAIATDIKAAFAAMIAADLDFAESVWIMTPATALALSLMQNALGQSEYPGISIKGGTWQGLPVVVSRYAAISGSPQFGNMIVLINPREIFLADDGQVTISISNEASIQMLDNPTNQSTGSTVATTMVSMFQTNSEAIKAVRYVNWAKRRASAAAFIQSANYS